MPRLAGLAAAAIAAATIAAATTTAATTTAPPAEPRADRQPTGVTLPTDRVAAPAGSLTPLQAFPTGVALSPTGRAALVVAGPPFNGGVGVGAGPAGAGVALLAVDPSTGQLRQTLEVADAYQTPVFSPDGTTVYVPGGSTGQVHVFAVDPLGQLTPAGELTVGGYVSGVALAPDGQHLWATISDLGRLVEVSLASGATVATVAVPQPDQVLATPDGSTVYVSAWGGQTVTAVDTATLATRGIVVGLDPTGLALTPDGRLLVTNSGDATLATYDPRHASTAYTRLNLIGRGSDSPNAVAVGPDGRAYVTLGGDNAVAVLAPTGKPRAPWKLAGLVPAGWNPDAVAVDPTGHQLEIVSARGLAHSAAATVPYQAFDPAALLPDGAYTTVGTLQSLPTPTGRALAALTERVRAGLRRPDISTPRVLRPHGPIRHIIYVTRENKTYDADLGDLRPGPGNALVVFGQSVTPNLHAMERQYADALNFTYPGFASVTGHMWEDAGAVSDVFDHAVASRTGTHLTHLDDSWDNPANYPKSGLLVEQAWKAGRTVRTYNEETAQQSGLLPAQYQAPTSVFPNYNLAVPDALREQGWASEFAQFESHHCTGTLATTYGAHCALPALEYVYFGEDHTTVVDEPGFPTIQAQVADNDYATGKLLDAVSHSPDWASTLVVIVEDDPQGTGDHVSAYRGLLAIASPWIRRGYLSTAPYNLTSVVGTIDRILGLPPLTDFAATSRPLDDLFTSQPNLTPFTADASGVAAYPFVPLPGVPPTSDPAHGILSFTQPDATVQPLAGWSTWRQIKGPVPP